MALPAPCSRQPHSVRLGAGKLPIVATTEDIDHKSQTERLFHICRRLNDGARVNVRSLMEELEVSRATVFRDFELLRDRLHAPLVWDADDDTYTLEPQRGVGTRFILPGMWMEADQLYGMLTVLNIASAVAPGVAHHYRQEFAGLLKQAMAKQDIRGYRLNEKISVELPRPSGHRSLKKNEPPSAGVKVLLT